MKEKSLKVLVIVLTILVLGMGGFILYDKVFNKKIDNKVNEKQITYEVQILSSDGQCGVTAIYEYEINNKENTHKEILRNIDTNRTLEIIKDGDNTYFINRSCSDNSTGTIYSTNLKSLEYGISFGDNSFSNFNSSYINDKIYLINSQEVNVYDNNLNLLYNLKEKISLKEYKVLGIVNKYVFLSDNNYMYAVNLDNNYEIIKSNSIIPFTKSLYGLTYFRINGEDIEIYYKEKDNVEIGKYKFSTNKFNF